MDLTTLPIRKREEGLLGHDATAIGARNLKFHITPLVSLRIFRLFLISEPPTVGGRQVPKKVAPM